MTSARLQNRTALITGSSSGLGAAIALAFAAEGARICCVDLYPSPRSPGTNAQTGKSDDFHNRVASLPATHALIEKEHGEDRSIFVRADITKTEDVEAAIETCVRVFGRLDIMVNNAGISVESTRPTPLRIHETPETDFDKTMAINTRGVFLGCKYAIKQMLSQSSLSDNNTSQDRGVVVNTASIQGLVACRNCPSYNTSKHAVVGLTKQVALDYAEDGIRVNALCPGYTKTAMTQEFHSNKEALEEISKLHPLRGMGEVEDVAKAAVFLASDDARWLTGVALPVDGGYVLQ